MFLAAAARAQAYCVHQRRPEGQRHEQAADAHPLGREPQHLAERARRRLRHVDGARQAACDRARHGVADVVHVHRLQRLPPADALTGPLARADIATLTRHLAALAPSPDLRELYVRLAGELLRLPLALRDEQRAALEALLRKAL